MKIQKTVRKIIPWIPLACFISLFITFSITRYECYLESDISGGLIFAKQLASEGWHFLSKNWHYATELNPVSENLIYAFLFHFTSDYKTVHIIGRIIILALFLLSIYIFLFSFKKTLYFPLIACILIIPWTMGEYDLVYYREQCYNIKSSFIFIVLACLFLYNKTTNTRKEICFIACGSVIAFCCGINSARQFVTLFVPLAAVVIIYFFICLKKNKTHLVKKPMIFTITTTTIALIGFLINSLVLSKIYHFQSSHFTFNLSIQGIGNSIISLFKALGLNLNNDNNITIAIISNLFLILNVIALIIYIYLLKKNFAKFTFYSKFIFSVAVGGIVFTACAYPFSTSANFTTERYFVISTSLFVFLIPDVIEITNFPKISSVKKNFCFILIASTTIPFYIKSFSPTNKHHFATSNNHRLITPQLLLLNCKYGYATFWNSNVITQLTNGKIDMYTFSDYTKDKGLVEYKWIQSTKHDNFCINEKCFILLEDKECVGDLYDVVKKNGKFEFSMHGFKTFTFANADPLFPKKYKNSNFIR